MIISFLIVEVVELLSTPVPIIKYEVKSAATSTAIVDAVTNSKRFLPNFLIISAKPSRQIIAARAYAQKRTLSACTPMVYKSSPPVSLSTVFGIKPISRVAPSVIHDDQIKARFQFVRLFSTALIVASTNSSTSI